MPQPGRSRRRRGLPEAPERETRPAQRQEQERPTLPSSSQPRQPPTECLERERRRSSQKAGEGQLRVGRTHAAQGPRDSIERQASTFERDLVAPGEDALPSPSRMGVEDLRDFLCSGLPSTARRAGSVHLRDARGFARLWERRRGQRLAQRGQRRGVAVHAVRRLRYAVEERRQERPPTTDLRVPTSRSKSFRRTVRT